MIDRVVQQAILLVLTPIFDPNFSESSFGFRPSRSAHEAIHLVQQHIRAGYRWCVDMDLAKFFDTVQHDVLMNRVARKVRDKRLLRLIGNYLRAGVMVDTDFHPSTEGTMQGGPLSPLLANILLDDFDKEMEQRGHRFVRYAGEFLVFSKTEQSATRVFRSVERYLTGKLKLVVNHDKSSVCRTEDGRCLHASLNYDGTFKDGLATFITAYARRSCSISKNGFVGASALATGKQWYRVRTRIRMLMKLGVRQDEAISHGCSGRGYWVMSSSAAMHVAISIDYLKKNGLASLEEIWSKFASKKRTAGCGPARPVV